VSFFQFNRQKPHLPYGWRRLGNGTEILFNRTDEPLFVWRPNAKRPERGGLCPVGKSVREGLFYSDGADGSVHALGMSELQHALEILLDAWERGNRITAGVLGEWLRDKHLAYLERTRAYREKLERRREEREFLEDFENMLNNPAKPA
jgi:hypothetical protein